MTKKAQASIKPGLSMRHVLCLGWKLVILLSVALCVFAFLRIQQYSQSTAALPRKSRSLTYEFNGNPKVAFLFLVRRNLPLDFLWESFFEVGAIFVCWGKSVVFVLLDFGILLLTLVI